MTVVSISGLKDTVKIDNLCAEENGPILVTKNGHRKLVIMGIEYFERIMNHIFEAKMINEGLSDMKNGMVKDGQIVHDEMKKKYNF